MTITLLAALHPFHGRHPVFFVAGHPAGAGDDPGATLAALIYMMAGILLMWVGRAIRRPAGLELFRGYASDGIRAPAELGEWAGGRITGLAMLTLVTGGLLMMFPEQAGLLVSFFLIGMLGGTLAMVRGLHRYRA